MTDQVAISIPRPSVKEGSAFTATAYFRDRATQAASAPTNIRYRIDCLTTGTVLADWTSTSAASSVSISVTGTHNAIQSQCNAKEIKQLTISADHGLSTQVRECAQWEVHNVLVF